MKTLKLFLFIASLLFFSAPAKSEVSDAEYLNTVSELSPNSSVNTMFQNLSTPQDFVNLWRYYHNTHNKEIVHRIISLLDNNSYSTGNQQVDNIVRKIAEVSLKVQADEFVEIKQIIVEKANNIQNGPLRQKLLNIINSIEVEGN